MRWLSVCRTLRSHKNQSHYLFLTALPLHLRERPLVFGVVKAARGRQQLIEFAMLSLSADADESRVTVRSYVQKSIGEGDAHANGINLYVWLF